MMSFFTHTMSTAELKRRLGIMRELARKAGRNPDDIEVTGMIKVYPASSLGESEKLAQRVAREITTGNFPAGLPYCGGGARRARAFDRHYRGDETRDSLADRRTRLHLVQNDLSLARVCASVRQKDHARVRLILITIRRRDDAVRRMLNKSGVGDGPECFEFQFQ